MSITLESSQFSGEKKERWRFWERGLSHYDTAHVNPIISPNENFVICYRVTPRRRKVRLQFNEMRAHGNNSCTRRNCRRNSTRCACFTHFVHCRCISCYCELQDAFQAEIHGRYFCFFFYSVCFCNRKLTGR